MTVKEAEQQTGLARANIRFYEEKGLLCPTREDNGYRLYSTRDIESLRRIRLLRLLDVSLEDIRALQTGEKQLEQVLLAWEEALSQDWQRAETARGLCRAIRLEGGFLCQSGCGKVFAAPGFGGIAF